MDLYTAEVLETLSQHGKIPQPGWPQLKVVITKNFARMYRSTGRGEFVDRMAKHGVAARKLAETPRRWVTMIRSSLIADYERAEITPCPEDAWAWSMWRGYLGRDDGAKIHAWFDAGGVRSKHAHTSGHASPTMLREFAAAMDAKTMVPIHGVAWDHDVLGFPHISRLADGQPLTV